MLAILLFLACAAHAPVPPAPPATEEAAEAIAPQPLTLAQLRDGFPAGTRVRYRIEQAGEPAVEERWTVTAADAETCTIATTVHDAATGALLEDQGPHTSTWAELHQHAAFPASRTVRAEGEIDVPAGHYATLVYTVTTPDGVVQVFHFAPALPGPPVLLTMTKDGVELLRMTLLERVQP